MEQQHFTADDIIEGMALVDAARAARDTALALVSVQADAAGLRAAIAEALRAAEEHYTIGTLVREATIAAAEANCGAAMPVQDAVFLVGTLLDDAADSMQDIMSVRGALGGFLDALEQANGPVGEA